MVYPNRPRWMRLATILAGPAANYLTAFVLMLFVLLGFGMPSKTQKIDEPVAGPAGRRGRAEGGRRARRGERPGGRRRAPDQRGHPGRRTARRSPSRSCATASRWSSTSRPTEQGRATRSASRSGPSTSGRRVGSASPPRRRSSIRTTRRSASSSGLYDMIRGKVQADLSGPIGITKQIAKAASRGAVDFLGMLILLSVYLGLFNLLPLPALDGGRAVFLGVESVTRRRVEPAHRGGRAHGGFRAAVRRAAGRQLQGHLREGVERWARAAREPGRPARRGGSAVHAGLGRRARAGRDAVPRHDPELRRPSTPATSRRAREPRWRKILAEVYGRRHRAARPGARSRRRDGGGRRGAAARFRRRAGRRRASTGSPRPACVTANLAVALPAVEGRFDLDRRRAPAGRAVRRSPGGRADRRAGPTACAPGAKAAGAGRHGHPGRAGAARDVARAAGGARSAARGGPMLVVAPCFWTGAVPGARERARLVPRRRRRRAPRTRRLQLPRAEGWPRGGRGPGRSFRCTVSGGERSFARERAIARLGLRHSRTRRAHPIGLPCVGRKRRLR